MRKALTILIATHFYIMPYILYMLITDKIYIKYIKKGARGATASDMNYEEIMKDVEKLK